MNVRLVIRVVAVAGGALASAACAGLLGLSGFDPVDDPGGAADGASPNDPEGGPPDTCANGSQDVGEGETDQDCGGARCGKCARGKKCAAPSDCASGTCDGGFCAGCLGVVLIDAGGACIDPTEVRVADYDAFVNDGPRNAYPEDQSRCRTRIQHPLDLSIQRATPGHPVRKVTWCAAKTYCRWRGQRLCGAFDVDAGVDDRSFADFRTDQWMAGCCASERRSYPYDPNGFDPNACNGADNKLNLNGPWDAGAGPDCKTRGLPIYDMSGNVAEWEDACEGRDGVRCRVRGGSYLSKDGGLTCGADETRELAVQYADVGFRCCE
jgi:formylglycine-generating enzyme